MKKLKDDFVDARPIRASEWTRTFRRVLVLLGMLIAIPSQAHVLGQSYVFLNVDEHSIDGRVEITTKDLNQVLNLGLPEEGVATIQQILSHTEQIDEYIQQRVALSGAGFADGIKIVDHGYLNTSFAQYVRVYFELPTSRESIAYLDVTNSLVFHADEKHRSLLVVENNWKTGVFDNEILIALTFSPENRMQRLELSEGSVFTGLLAFVKLGLHHIWIGADHILFLLALLLPSVLFFSGGSWSGVSNFKSAFIHIIKIVTVFTVAHSITLSLAALSIVSLPSRLVESIIAVSIGIAALHILLPRVRFQTYAVVLLFGLFHGFGFASVLGEMQIPDRYMIWSLLGFNLGVELGQVTIVSIFVPLLFSIRNSRAYTRFVLPLSAFGLIAISAYWFIERAFDLDFRVGTALRSLIGI